MIKEVWKDIEGYEGLYQVSNLGRVRSVDRIDCRGNRLKGRILSLVMNNYGYLQVCLSKEGKHKMLQVHRLVGMSFIPNPEGLSVINHKDEDKTNNRVLLKDDGSVDECQSNLEWCDQKYNINYGTHTERQVQTKIRKGMYDPELCGLTEKERKRLYYQKNLEEMRKYQREYMRKYRLKKKQKKNKNNKPSEEPLW